MDVPTTLDEAYERLGLRPVLEFEQEALEYLREIDPEGHHGKRRIGTSTQVLVELLIDLISYEASPAYPQGLFQDPNAPTRREDDFVLVMGPGYVEGFRNQVSRESGEFYKRLGGRHPVRDDGPPNLWIVNWDRRNSLRGSHLPNDRYFFDPWSSVGEVPHGPPRLIREIPPKPVMKAADGSWVYEALDRSGRRIALVTTQQAQSLASWTIRPIKIGGDWARPRGTYP